MHDAVADESAGHGFGYGTCPAHHIQGVQVVVVPQVDRPFAVNLLAQGGLIERGFEIMQGQGIAGQEPLDITPADEAR